MRLPIEDRLTRVQKIVLGVMKALLGDAPGPMMIASYNKRFFGNAWAACIKNGMRGATEWSVGEVELFAAFVSRLNSCGY